MSNSQKAPIKVLWDGGSAMAVHKPAGLATQAAGQIESLERRLLDQFRERTDYLAIVHRLDRPVSGVLLVALTKRAARTLSEQFAARRTQKTYLAWVQGQFPIGDRSEWSDWIRKLSDLPMAEICSKDSDAAKQAQTIVQGLEYDSAQGRTLIQMQPVTGRMHQLRIQAASRGFPIVGDQMYGCSEDDSGRILLHASSLTFHDPKTCKKVIVSCPADEFGLSD